MTILPGIIALIASYVIGSIPFGLLIVKLKSGKDIRSVESGRIGGTNAFRAAGILAGAATTLLDGAKAFCAVWIARYLTPGNYWIEIFAPLCAIVGHNYSIFLIERNEKGRLRLRGGAGGASCAGGAIGLWPPVILIILPIALLIIYFIGYASVTTMSIALIVTITFIYRAIIGASPWQYVLYGIIAEALLIWALRPNIKRLIQGNERLVGYRAHKKSKHQSSSSPSSSPDFSSKSSSK